MIIALCGQAGSGKDACADALVERRGFVKISLADPLKRILADVFGWDRDRLYGSSANRNVPDPAWDGLTARHALQTLGTEWGRACHPDVWVRACLREAARIAPSNRECAGVVIPDCRFGNEVAAIRKAGGRVVRIVRPGLEPLDGAAGAHESETGIDALDVDLDLPNNGELWMLQARAARLPEVLFGRDAFDTGRP